MSIIPSNTPNKFNNQKDLELFVKGIGTCFRNNVKGIEKNGFEFRHDAATDEGSSGSPILLKNNLKVIGIHRGGVEEEKVNYGTFLFDIIQKLNSIEDLKIP